MCGKDPLINFQNYFDLVARMSNDGEIKQGQGSAASEEVFVLPLPVATCNSMPKTSQPVELEREYTEIMKADWSVLTHNKIQGRFRSAAP